MKKPSLVIAVLMLMAILFLFPSSVALADTAYNAEIVTNGGGESGAEGTIGGWTDETGQSRWNAMGTYQDWPVAVQGSRYFYLYCNGLANLSGSMSQWITLSGTEGSGLFSSISAGNVGMHFSISMYQKISADNEVKAIIEQYSSSGTLLATSNVACTTAGSGAFGAYTLNTQLNPDTRKFKLTMNATLTNGGYAQYDAISLKLVDASTGSAPVFGSDFPAEGSTDANVAYSHSFTITDADAGDVDNLTFSADSDNVNLVPVANVVVSGSGANRTLTVTPVSNLSGEANITITASDGSKSANATIHLVVSKVITLGSNLVVNGNATSGTAGWSDSSVNVTASGNGFVISAPGYGMYQKLDISKFSAIIDGGAADYTFSASDISGGTGKVELQFYSDIACTSVIGGVIEINQSTKTSTDIIPAGAMGTTVAFSSTDAGYRSVTIRNISFIIPNDFPKMTAISAQTARLSSLIVPVYVYYTTTSATLTATSSDQSVIPNSGIVAGGSGFNRSLTITPLKDGTTTITATVSADSGTATRTFDVTVHEPAAISSIGKPNAGYYCAGQNLDFTVTFNRNIKGGTASVLPLTIGGSSVDAAYYAATANTITYRYTLGSDDEGTVTLGSAIDDTASAITDTADYEAELTIADGTTGVTAIPTPEVTSSAAGDTAVYGTPVTFTMSLTCANTLTGTVQFQADGVNIGSPVTLSGNRASYQTEPTALTVGSPAVTANFIPGTTDYNFASLSGSACRMTITAKSVTVTGLTATNRAYDGTTVVALSGGALDGVLDGDSVSATYPSSGTVASANQGTQTVTFSAITLTGDDKGNYTLAGQPTVSVTISEKPLTFTATAADKVYDGTLDATVTGVTFDGLVTGETLTSGVDYTATAEFESASISNNVPVTVTVTLNSTTKAANYSLSSGTAATHANITKKLLTLTGVTATNRDYNGGTAVALTGGTLVGLVSTDAGKVGFTLGNGAVADANAGTAKVVTTGIVLTGDAADAYTLTQPDYVTVDIAKATLMLGDVTVANKGYDGDAKATVTDVSINGAVAHETLTFGTDFTATGHFSDANVGHDKNVTVTVTLAGTALAANYSLPVNTASTTASITNSGVTITGVVATNRAYDGTLTVTLTGGTLVGIAAGDAADIGFTLNTGTLDDANAGDGKAVTTNIVLTGTNAGNYTLTQPSEITVDIAKAELTISSAAASNKPYDATTDATVTAVTFGGLVGSESLTENTDYTVTGVFNSADAGLNIPVAFTVTLTDTATARNYTISGPGSAAADITPLGLTGTVVIDVTNTTGDAGLIDEGDVLTADTTGISLPGTLTVNYQWYRNGNLISGETAASYTVGNLSTDPVGALYTVKIEGTGNYRGTLESSGVTVIALTLGGSISITGDTSLGDTLTVNASSLTPANATYSIRWLRHGTDIMGASAATYAITAPDQNTTISVIVTGTGYYNGSLSAAIDIPPSPYLSDGVFHETADRETVDLTLGSTLLSEDQMAMLLGLNATKPVIFMGNGYSILFPVGAMTPWPYDLDLGVRFNEGTGYNAIEDSTGSTFVLMFEFLHSGSLPGEAEISIDVGDQYAGQMLRYLYYNPLTGKLELVQTVVADSDGHITVTQDHCSSYALAKLVAEDVPNTGDSTPLTLLWALAGVCAAGLLVLLGWRARNKTR